MLRLILNEVLPGKLRKALDREAKAKDITLNDVAVSILARHYRVRRELSGNRYRSSSASKFKLHVPEEVHRRIRVTAATDSRTVRGVALNILSSHYGLELISAQRRPRRKA